MSPLLNIGWFSTGRDEAARQLLQTAQDSIKAGQLQAKILFVFSNREIGEDKESDLFFDLVNNYGIPLICFSHRKFKALKEKEASVTKERTEFPRWRLEYDREVMKQLESYNPEICLLAGYMLIVGEEMCQKYNMVNLHPAAPGGPQGSWQEVIWKLIETKTRKSGIMMHLVTPELDKGPIVTYCTFSLRGDPFDKYWREIENYPIEKLRREQGENNPLFQLIRQHGLIREFPLIIATLKLFSQGKVRIKDGRVIDPQNRVIAGYNLSEEIDQVIKRK